MICKHCGEGIFKSTAGSPPAEYWTALGPNGLLFHCGANSNGPHIPDRHQPEPHDHIRLDQYNEDLINVKISVLCEVGRALERLRLSNPMTGDGSNFMLDKCLREVIKLDGTGLTADAIADENQAVREEREAAYLKLERENQLRQRNRYA